MRVAGFVRVGLDTVKDKNFKFCPAFKERVVTVHCHSLPFCQYLRNQASHIEIMYIGGKVTAHVAMVVHVSRHCEVITGNPISIFAKIVVTCQRAVQLKPHKLEK